MYRKEWFIFDGDRPLRAVIRNYSTADYEGLLRIQQESFPPPYPQELLWSREQIASQIEHFADGALCVEIEGELAGSVTSLLMHYNPEHPQHTWEEVADDGYIRTHCEDAKALYVIDLAVRPAYRRLGLGKWLIFSLYHLVIERRLDRLLGAGRMPGYQHHADQLSAEAYVDAVVSGELKDPVLTFLLRCGRVPVCILPNYLDDEQSRNYAALMEWRNPFHTHH
ncbi:GNAT family N-acetyltransferase [Paenibacillus peoriae]|uniref:GNAT family N-acetyltransferase n=1 Tax=Paenibacillus peoriae TaxID=59893 RepID=UPI00215AA6F3|nr:GNAT family N-acetyltransferase [Paenibacillus peoriae]